MSYIAGMYLLYCSEYDSFVGFTNFIHQHYFFDLFKGHLSDVSTSHSPHSYRSS